MSNNCPSASDMRQASSYQFIHAPTGGGPGYCCLRNGGGFNTMKTGPPYVVPCSKACAAFAAINPCTYSPMLAVIASQIFAAKQNYEDPVVLYKGATDADILTYLLTDDICNGNFVNFTPTSELVNQYVTKGINSGVFVYSSSMCDGTLVDERAVCIDPYFGFYPQNANLYREMGSTPYYMYCLGIL